MCEREKKGACVCESVCVLQWQCKREWVGERKGDHNCLLLLLSLLFIIRNSFDIIIIMVIIIINTNIIFLTLLRSYSYLEMVPK